VRLSEKGYRRSSNVNALIGTASPGRKQKKYRKQITVCACGRPGIKLIDGDSVCARCLSLPEAGEFIRGNYRKDHEVHT